MENSPLISIRKLSKSFCMPEGENKVLRDFSLDIEEKEFVCLLGHSGCGKSTLLRLLAGFEIPDSGELYVDGLIHDRPSKDVIMLFQDFNQLLPWKTVVKNVMHPSLATGTCKNKKEAMEKAERILEDVGLAEYKTAYPYQLSGGMKQRAAVARALIMHPKVLLMDEPFASLDEMNRRFLQELTIKICKRYGITTVFVTHSIEEAIVLADRIVVLGAETGSIRRIIKNEVKCTEKKKQIAFASEIMELMME